MAHGEKRDQGDVTFFEEEDCNQDPYLSKSLLSYRLLTLACLENST